ncbi:MAG: T9SS type A sorting domain-containing protein [Bacteroidaceae bacterium]|nr:T9SS type A sorting domain-containing protein [Bacteroidaceae bacterium]
MKKIIISVLMSLFVLPCVAADKNTLVVHLTDGTSVGFLLAERPRVTFAGDSLRIVSSVAEAVLLRSEVRRFEFVADAASSVVDVPTASGECVISENQLSVSGLSSGATVRLYSLDGRLLRTVCASDAGVAYLSTDGLSTGVYVINFNSTTLKFLKK